MEFRLAEPRDLDSMEEIVARAKEYFKEKEIDQWQKGYPNRASLTEDIERGQAYVLTRQGQVLAMLAAIYQEDKNYEKIEGSWLSQDSNYVVIHRLAVDPDQKGQGLAGLMLKEVEELAKGLGAQSIRVDTHRDNRPMIRLLEKAGLIHCGKIYLLDENLDQRLAFEKLLKD